MIRKNYVEVEYSFWYLWHIIYFCDESVSQCNKIFKGDGRKGNICEVIRECVVGLE